MFQLELFYLDNGNTIREWNNNPAGAAANGNGSISALGWKVGAGTSLTAYWPNIFYQDDSATLQQIWYNSGWSRAGTFGPVGSSASAVDLLNRTGLGVIPRDQDYNGVEVFYQRDDGKLQEFFWYPESHGSFEGWTVGM